MLRPSLIEFVVPNGPRIYLVFQDMPLPLLREEMHGDEIWVSRCPQDGTLFLEGRPEDYIDETICLDPPDGVIFKLSAEMALAINSAEECSFGMVVSGENGGTGPGFYNGETFQHDRTLGVSTDSSIVSAALGTSAGIVVGIDRPHGFNLWKYYDESDQSVNSSDGERSQAPGARDDNAADLDMGDMSAGENRALSFEAVMESRMRSLRLRER